MGYPGGLRGRVIGLYGAGLRPSSRVQRVVDRRMFWTAIFRFS